MNKRIRKKRAKNLSMKQNVLRDVKDDNISMKADKNSDKVITLFVEQTGNKNTLEYVKLFISVFIAVIGFILTMRSNAIYKMQKEIQEKQISPAIDISVTLKDKYDENMNETIDKLTICNVGGIAEYIDCYAMPFFLVEFCELESGEELFPENGVIIPIKSYTVPVIANENMGFRSGEIARIYANENLQDIVNNIKQWEYFEIDPKALGNKKIVHVSIGYFLEIDCQDLFQKEWTEYYSCLPGYDASYGKLPDVFDTKIGVMKIAEEDGLIDTVKTCFGEGEMVGDFIYENGRSFEDNYMQFLNLFCENYDKDFYYDIVHTGEIHLIEYEDGRSEVKRVK